MIFKTLINPDSLFSDYRGLERGGIESQGPKKLSETVPGAPKCYAEIVEELSSDQVVVGQLSNCSETVIK